MNVNKIFLDCLNSHKRSRSNKKQLLKTLISILVVFLFLALPFNASITQSASTQTEENEDNCPLCAQADSKGEIYYTDLSKDEQLDLITFVLLYKKLGSEISYFDSLDENARKQHLDTLLTKDQLLSFYNEVEDEEIKEKILTVIDVYEGKTLPFCDTSTDEYISPNNNPNNNYLSYDPEKCNSFISGLINNFFNRAIIPALAAINYTLEEVVIPFGRDLIEYIWENTPYPLVLAISTVFGVAWKFSKWYDEYFSVIVDYIKTHQALVTFKVCEVVFFVTWIALIARSIICFIKCPEDETVIDNNKDSLGTYRNLIMNIFGQKNTFLRSIMLKLGFDLNTFNSDSKSIKTDPKINKKQSVGILGDNNIPEITYFDIPSLVPITTLRSGVEYTFLIFAEDEDGDQIYVKFDWGDGNSTDWIEHAKEGTEQSYTWAEGMNTVTVTAYATDADVYSRDESYLLERSDSEQKTYNFKLVRMEKTQALSRFFSSKLLFYLNTLIETIKQKAIL
jgi:hypothetical protein